MSVFCTFSPKIQYAVTEHSCYDNLVFEKFRRALRKNTIINEMQEMLVIGAKLKCVTHPIAETYKNFALEISKCN